MEKRLKDEPDRIKRAIADATAIWNVCPGSLKVAERQEFSGCVAGWADSPPELDDLNRAIQANIGGKESAWFKPGFQLQRGAHLRFILEFGRRLKVEQVDPSSYLDTRQLAQNIHSAYPRSASAKNMVLHMLFPNETEPIFNNWARDRIAEAQDFARFIDESSDFEDALASIRHWYETELGHRDFDFYDPDIRKLWRPEAEAPDSVEVQPTSELIQPNPTARQNWWVNQGDSYTTERDGGYLWAGRLNRAGRPMWHHETMRELQENDLIVHYANLHLRAIGRVKAANKDQERPTTRQPEAGSPDGYRVEIDYRELTPPVKVDQLPMSFRLAAMPPFNARGDVQQVYLAPLEPEWMAALYHRLKSSWPEDPEYQPSDAHAAVQLDSELGPPSIDDLVLITSLPQDQLSEIETLLYTKKQIIFEGPPGSGKTFVARLFARFLAGVGLDNAESDRVEIVQFHQSYGYEDFVAGIRPVTGDNGLLTYETRAGIFVDMCREAKERPGETFVLIIDEINRGNLSRIFGELLYGLEYRDQRVRMQYPVETADGVEEYLEIPGNLYLIGTMNSTDRSLAMIDYALRRRFYFWRLMPVSQREAPVLARWLERQESLGAVERASLLSAFIELNREIAGTLGEDFQIGHSYFMLSPNEIGNPLAWRRVWRHAIESLLREYLHMRQDANATIARLEQRFFRDPEPESELPAGPGVEA